jgi:hypothetical protein
MFTYLSDRHPNRRSALLFRTSFCCVLGKAILPKKSASAALLLDFDGGGESPCPQQKTFLGNREPRDGISVQNCVEKILKKRKISQLTFELSH